MQPTYTRRIIDVLRGAQGQAFEMTQLMELVGYEGRHLKFARQSFFVILTRLVHQQRIQRIAVPVPGYPKLRRLLYTAIRAEPAYVYSGSRISCV